MQTKNILRLCYVIVIVTWKGTCNTARNNSQNHLCVSSLSVDNGLKVTRDFCHCEGICSRNHSDCSALSTQKTHKQNCFGIVLGFSGDLVCVFFCPTRKMG